MALKYQVDSLDGIPEAHHSLYVEREGKYVLDVDGVEDVSGLKSALQKERDANKKARDELKAQAERYKDLDPDKAREALKRLQEMEDKELLDSGKVEELLQKRTERMRLDFDNQVGALKKSHESLSAERDTLNSRLSELLIDSSLSEAALKSGIRKDAIKYVLLQGKETWKLRDGKPTPLKEDQLIYGKSGTEPMTMEEWISGLTESSPFLLETSSGGGAANNGSNRGPGGRVIARGDPLAFGKHLEDIASGKVTVQ